MICFMTYAWFTLTPVVVVYQPMQMPQMFNLPKVELKRI